MGGFANELMDEVEWNGIFPLFETIKRKELKCTPNDSIGKRREI
jgi:hypothetical protein